ncbi:glycosyl transferase family 1 [candidate division WWE3 bacterium CG22_combo_CG10-13_8_21_14_all_39_12]|uniref:Glycosyltransferase family 1 protein n=2 Tax=Katanobacteria TaxID=422282 RepID=A0A2M7X426_UNCKA|nr:MAG: glycosyl transferase family 1 [candidate division WWE3 bacterium CG22_combo_CG10-13_8_21_14_all_39_12]PJA40890.1 MAG: glycosyltransferase family 1 protein [candidate division WWE3 bacterium CG_4_9_14_3_um_filter_39_7]
MGNVNNNKITIGVDASRAFSDFRTGTENYSYQIIKSFANSESPYNFKLYTRTDSTQEYGEIFSREGFFGKKIAFPVMWTQGGLALETWVSPPDLLFVPAHVIPFLKNIAVPTIVVVHDIRTEFLPHHNDWRQKLYLNPLIERIRAGLATHIIAVSQSTKNDIVKELRVDPDKVSVVYEGVDRNRFSPDLRANVQSSGAIKERYGLKKPYLLFVGTVQPRKNLERLIEACSQVPIITSGQIDVVIVGKKGWLAEDIYTAPARFGIESQVKFLDYVNDDDLPYLYANAQSFVFPSLYEGFGLPVLEALSVGVPVVTSQISSLPEVGGDLALYVDPFDTSSIAQGIIESLGLTLDEEKINSHLQKFTWSEAGRKTLEIIDKVIQR